MESVLVLWLVILRRLYNMTIADKLYELYKSGSITKKEAQRKFINAKKYIADFEKAKREFMYLMSK